MHFYKMHKIFNKFPFFQAKRQQRKLNFLITQTELYAHFMSRKINGLQDIQQDQILGQLDEPKRETEAKSSSFLKDDDNYGKPLLFCQKLDYWCYEITFCHF